jgi:hypothetical protein
MKRSAEPRTMSARSPFPVPPSLDADLSFPLFPAKMMSGWRYSESSLVDGEQVVCTPGGKGRDGAGYSSIVAANIDGVRQYLQILGRGAIGVEARTGKFLYDKKGIVALIEAAPEGFKVKGTLKPAVVEGPAWPYPVIHDGKLYLRAHDTLMCYDVCGQ